MTTLPVTTARLESVTRAQVRAHKRRRARVCALLMALCAAAFLLSLTFGSVSIPVRDVLAALTGQATERASWTVIVLDYRLPKALTALLAGAALGVSGAGAGRGHRGRQRSATDPARRNRHARRTGLVGLQGRGGRRRAGCRARKLFGGSRKGGHGGRNPVCRRPG